MTSYLDTAYSLFQHNQLLQAAVVAAPATAITYSLRTMPKSIYKTIRKWITLDIRMNNDMASYSEALQFLTADVICDKFTRNYNYQSESKWNWDEDVKEITNRSMSIGYGRHIGFFKKRLVVIQRSVEEDSKTEKFKEYTHVTIFARKKQVIADFKDGVEAFAGRARDGQEKVQLKANSGTYWSNAGKLPLRSLDTVFSANNAAERCVQHILDFDAKRDWNHSKGLPHHTGILLYGPPGTGKSSLLHAIASATGRTIYYLNLSSIDKDKELTDLFGGVTDWTKVLVVIEDIDGHGIDMQREAPQIEEASCPDDDDDDAPKPVKKVKKQPVSLSTLLNTFDGLLTPDGLVLAATTNHLESLDEALTRAGRFDLTIELGHLGKPEFEKMANLFELDASGYTLPDFKPMSGATMRALLLEGGVPAIEQHQAELLAA